MKMSLFEPPPEVNLAVSLDGVTSSIHHWWSCFHFSQVVELKEQHIQVCVVVPAGTLTYWL